MPTKISSQPYKGTRDFFPSDYRLLTFLKNQWSKTCLSFGFEAYDGPTLEPFEIFAAKTGEEVVQQQLFSFQDRGERSVALRPEMTPTLARMIASQYEVLPKPCRWFSIPNCFRYERPQKGRLREFWQLNVDCLGGDSAEADLEMLLLAQQILLDFGAKPSMFSIRGSHRSLWPEIFRNLGVESDEVRHKTVKLIDQRSKIEEKNFQSQIEGLLSSSANQLLRILEDSRMQLRIIAPATMEYFEVLEERAKKCGVHLQLDLSVVRGLDYYTGFVFEVYDEHSENRRAMFGGGRYDNLLELFGKPTLSGVGFGVGDVTFRDFLEVHGLLPVLNSTPDILIVALDGADDEIVHQLGTQLRHKGLVVERNLLAGKLSKVWEYCERKKIKVALIIGRDEITKNKISARNIGTREVVDLPWDVARVVEHVK